MVHLYVQDGMLTKSSTVFTQVSSTSFFPAIDNWESGHRVLADQNFVRTNRKDGVSYCYTIFRPIKSWGDMYEYDQRFARCRKNVLTLRYRRPTKCSLVILRYEVHECTEVDTSSQ